MPHFFLTLLISLLTLPALSAGQTSSRLGENSKIVFFGDSITRAGTAPGGYVDLFTKSIAAAYPGKSVEVLGAGIGGNKTTDLLARVDRDVIAKNPTHVVIYIGINDIWHWTRVHPVTGKAREGVTSEQYEVNLRKLTALLQKQDIEVILCTPTIIGENVSASDENYLNLNKYSRIVRKIAADTSSPLIDLRKEFVSYLTTHNPEKLTQGILTTDGVHMNPAGQNLLAAVFCRHFGIPFDSPIQTSETLPDAGMDIYLLIGQSNMAGRANIPENTKAPLPDCFLFNENAEWAPAANPLNQYSTIRKEISMQKLGPGYSFAEAMVKSAGGTPVGLVVNARGGSRIGSWKKGSAYYREALARTRVACTSGTLRGILWHQGESDGEDTAYLPKLIDLVENLRKDLEAPDLPFIAGQIHNNTLINGQISQLPERLEHTACVSSGGLVTRDGVHFDSASQLELGRRFAAEMLRIRQSK